ncbi:MAG: acyltransferase family protein [Desulfarculaceae bacterium]|nr:acyltransferase family protein [Desulfarculaceae bacterium]
MCFVVVIHSGGFWVANFERSLNWLVANLFNASARFAVPCFVMCSGALFLRRKLDTKEEIIAFYRKYLPHYAMYVVAALVIGKGFQLYGNSKAPLFEGLIYNLYNGYAGIIWYFFMFLGLIVATPVLRQIVLNPYITKLFLVLWFLFAVIKTTFDNYLGAFSFYVYNIIYASVFAGYYVLGYQISMININLSRRKIALFVAISWISVLISTSLDCFAKNKFSGFFYLGSSPFVAMFALSIFMYFQKTFVRPSNKLVSELSQATLYVYIVHNFLLPYMKQWLGTKNPAYTFFVPTLATIVLSFAIGLAYLMAKRVGKIATSWYMARGDK